MPPLIRSKTKINVHNKQGFILLLLSSNLCLWNPSTGANKPLALSPIACNEDALFFTFLYGFGYDPSTDDYIVVLASYDPEADLETFFELFSVKANAWNRIEGMNLPYIDASDDPRAGTLLNGVIHWLAFRYDVLANVIVAFDLTERSFSDVLLSANLNQELTFCDLRVLGGGLLCLCQRRGGRSRTEIWVMEEYKVQSSWTKSIVVSFDDIPSLYFSPRCSTKSGDIVGIDDSTVLVKCNAEGQILEQHSYSDDPHGCEVVMYTESLLSLPIEIGQAAGGDV
ncbi:hypothetical protein RIF29_24806 [Crotalaria pallida]|uniref:F-box associated beta-propeller type 1 domain-containing protein n=1 Tax=Crotalaria pallida TaxID=3830 RepID=A0AAN9EL70_CROPI